MQTSANPVTDFAKEIRRVVDLPNSDSKATQLSALRDEFTRTYGVKPADAETFLAGYVQLRASRVKRLAHA